jgi:hypothetical protein
MAYYRGFVFKDTGRILNLPGPERYWGNDVHDQYRGIMDKEGLGDFVGNWKDTSKVKYFSSESQAQTYSKSIKTNKVLGEEARVGVNPKALTPQERNDNYNKAIAAYSSKIKTGKLSETENDLLNKYKSAAIVSSPKNIVDAANNYSIEFSLAKIKGIGGAGESAKSNLSKYAQQIKSFDSKNLSAGDKLIVQYVGDVQDAIDAVDNQTKLVATQAQRAKSLEGKQREDAQNRLIVEQDALQRLTNTSNQRSAKVSEALGKVGLSETSQLSTTEDARIGKLSAGLSSLGSSNAFQTGDLAYKLNSQVTDQQIINDINTAKKNQYKQLYDIGTQAATDLSSKIAKAKELLPGIAKSEQAGAKTKIAELQTQLTKVNSDIVKANNLYTKYKPISGAGATSAVASFRNALRLPEQRTIDQINEIDPTVGATVKAMSQKYKAMAETPLGATTTPQTEELRNTIEQEAINQLRLGSTIGAEERRGYEQSIRGAQTARGNVFGLGPAVQEAANIGMAGEQRKLARYGAASAFLGSGETTGAATARDLGLRNALEQSRLGAAQGFIASGPTMYNLASQRLGTQQNLLNNYLAASQPKATGGFQTTPSAASPYAYVNPNAGFQGAQNAAGIYNSLADYKAKTYSAYTGAVASQPSGAQNFGAIMSGVGSFVPSFAFGA